MTSDESSRRPAAAVGSIDPQLLQLVSEATQGEYAILGELGRDGDRSYFLARELATGALVVLGMWEELDPEGTPQIAVSVFRQIDATMPAPGALCHACGGVVDRWERFCLSCGADLSGAAADDSVPGGSREALLAAVKAAAEDGYDVLGTIDRAEGGGVVYFAFEESTGRLVGLSLQQQDDPTTSELEYELVVTWCTPDAPAAAPTPAAPAAAMTVATGQLREKAAADRVPPAAAAAAPSGTP